MISHLLSFLLGLGAVGLLLLAIADDSFLSVPIGSDLLMVLLVARRHEDFLICVLAAAAGSAICVILLDLVVRKGGEKGLQRLVKPKLLTFVKRKIEKNAGVMIAIGCLAPPPFPFGAFIAAASAFQYPRTQLVLIVLVARAARFALVGWAALYFGQRVLTMAESPGFLWFAGAFIALCVVGSVVSVVRWTQIGRSR